MKKLIAAILAVLYLGTSSGATIHMHYCMGELADWGLGDKQSKTCGKCGMEEKDKKENGCCKDEQKFVKNNSDQKITESSFHFNIMKGVVLVPNCAETPLTFKLCVTEENPNSNSPPRTQAVSVYIRNCVFRI